MPIPTGNATLTYNEHQAEFAQEIRDIQDAAARAQSPRSQARSYTYSSRVRDVVRRRRAYQHFDALTSSEAL